jgi:hypothetical protein
VVEDGAPPRDFWEAFVEETPVSRAGRTNMSRIFLNRCRIYPSAYDAPSTIAAGAGDWGYQDRNQRRQNSFYRT